MTRSGARRCFQARLRAGVAAGVVSSRILPRIYLGNEQHRIPGLPAVLYFSEVSSCKVMEILLYPPEFLQSLPPSLT
jgi:hypothetical protein